MKFRNYCIIIIGDTFGVDVEIASVAETKPNILNGKGMLIATFTSVSTPKELEDQFKDFKRNFLVFDLSSQSSGYSIRKLDIHEGLFGFLRTMTDDRLRDRTEDLINEINMTSDTKDVTGWSRPPRPDDVVKMTIKKPKEKKITEEDLDKMTITQKSELMNDLIDKGVENLSEHDKKILQKLAI